MRWYTQLLILLVIFIIIVLIFIIINYTWPGSQSVTISPTQTKALIEEPCSTSLPCSPGYVCENICKADLGSECHTLSDCTKSATVCDGTCRNTLIGGFNQPCPCGIGLECAEINGTVSCKIAQGHPCLINEQCSKNICTDGFCQPGKLLGGSCTTNSQCESDLQCNSGYCQPIGINTGDTGAYCSSSGPFCSGSDRCKDNVCRQANLGLRSACDNTHLCAPQYDCVIPSGNSIGFCTFPVDPITGKDAPTTCPQGICGNGFTCVSGTCRSNSNRMCSINSDCVISSTCNTSTQQVWFWNEAIPEWQLFAAVPAGVIFSRLVARLVGPDVLYAGSFQNTAIPSGVYRWTGAVWTKDQPGVFTQLNTPILGTNRTFQIVDFTVNIYFAFPDIYVLYQATETPPGTIRKVIWKNGAPYNVTSSISGTQFFGINPINAIAIDVSSNNTILLLDILGNIYYRPYGAGLWLLAPGVFPLSSRPSFYNLMENISENEFANVVGGGPPNPVDFKNTLNLVGQFPQSNQTSGTLIVSDFRTKGYNNLGNYTMDGVAIGFSSGIGHVYYNNNSKGTMVDLPNKINTNSKTALGLDTVYLLTDGRCT